MIQDNISHNPLHLNTISQHPPMLRGERLFPWCPASTLLPWSLVARVSVGVGVCDCSLIQDQRECDNQQTAQNWPSKEDLHCTNTHTHTHVNSCFYPLPLSLFVIQQYTLIWFTLDESFMCLFWNSGRVKRSSI